MIVGIDPGNEKSAYVVIDDELRPVEFGKLDNWEFAARLPEIARGNHVAIEMVASYGMAVGETVFETCVWIGRFLGLCKDAWKTARIKRIEVKNHLCHSSRAKDANVRQALIDRFGVVGTKKNPGWFFGFANDVWAAYAVAVTYADRMGLSTSVSTELPFTEE